MFLNMSVLPSGVKLFSSPFPNFFSGYSILTLFLSFLFFFPFKLSSLLTTALIHLHFYLLIQVILESKSGLVKGGDSLLPTWANVSELSSGEILPLILGLCNGLRGSEDHWSPHRNFYETFSLRRWQGSWRKILKKNVDCLLTAAFQEFLAPILVLSQFPAII